MRTVFRDIYIAVIVAGLLFGPSGPPGYAQAPVAGQPPPPAPLSAQQLEDLVGRIALYPDDLVAIILPAATYPLDIVQADRFISKLKQDKTLKPDPRWDESIRNLVNYPDVIGMMSQDLDWTEDLGEAVVSQQSDVLKAIQSFRAKAASVGSLKSDDKQLIVQEKEVIKIVPADPEVIYVPQYQPSAVVVQAAPPAYYPAPYPSYYYPYPPGAALATGVAIGAATAWACNWSGGHVENNVNINNTDNLNVNRNNPQAQQKATQARQQAQQRAQQPGTTQARQQGQGARGQAGASQWQSQKRPGEVSQGRVSPQTAQSRPGYGGGGASQGDAFGSGGRGSDAMRDSSRGSESRASASTMDRGGAQAGGGARGGASASTMDRGGGGSRGGGGGGGSASMGGGGSRGGGGGGGGGRGGGGGGRRR